MGRKGDGPRKQRLALVVDNEEIEPQQKCVDAQAAQEKKLRAIAHAAAVSSGNAPATLIASSTVPTTAPDEAVFKAPAPKPRPMPTTQGSLDDLVNPLVVEDAKRIENQNPLASLLGYDGEEDEDIEVEGEHSTAELSNSTGAETLFTTDGKEEMQNDPCVTLAGGKQKDLDAELASFLSELETSGLLKDDSAAGGDAGAPEGALRETDESHTVAAQQRCASTLVPTQVFAEFSGPTGHGAAKDETAGVVVETSAAMADVPVQGEGKAAKDAEGSSAEQRVLGNVPGADGWCRVMDMGSGQIYFWHQETDKVAWDPPEGAAASIKGDGEAAAGAHSIPGMETSEVNQGETHVPAQLPQGDGEAECHNLAPQDPQPGLGSAPIAEDSQGIVGPVHAPAAALQSRGAALAKLLMRPNEDTVAAAAAVAQRCTHAAGNWLEMVPQVVRLAIEAQSIATLLSLFCQQQTAAVDSQSIQAALSWEGLQIVLSNAVAALDAQLPGAVDSAHQLHASLKSGQQPSQLQQQKAGEQKLQQSEGQEPQGDVEEVVDYKKEEEEEVPPPLPPEPEGQVCTVAAPICPSGNGGNLSQQLQQQTNPSAGTLCGAGTERSEVEGSGEAAEAPPLPGEDVSMDLDDDETVTAHGEGASGAGAPGAGGTLGLAGQGQGGSNDEEEGEIVPSVEQSQRSSLPSYPPATVSEQPAGLAAPPPACVPGAEPLLPSSFPWPPWFGAFTPPLPLPIAPPGPLPFHPLFLPPVCGLPPLYPYHPLPESYPTVSEAAAVQHFQPPLPPSEELTAATQDKRKEYSAHAQPAAASSRGAEQPPLPVAENGRNVNLEQNSLYNEVSQTKSEESMAIRKRKQEKAAGSKKAKAVKLDKGTVSLISKWQAVQKQVQKLEKAEEVAAAIEADPEAKLQADEERKLREAEEWRLQQLRTGTVGDNANFAPLVGDWRDRLKKMKKKKIKAAVTLNSANDSSKGVPDLDALSKGLPDDWRAMFDKGSCKIYYGNLQTQETQWDRPI